MSSQKSVLFVLSSAAVALNGKPTGWFLPELAHPYYELKDTFKVTIASPAGGEAPLDPASISAFKDDEGCIRFQADEKAQKLVKNTVKLSAISSTDFDAVYYVGGQGPVVDLPYDEVSIKLIEDFYSSGKITGFVCHAPATLLKAKYKGEPLIKGKHFTGFSNSEEEGYGRRDFIPFLLETELGKLGGLFEKGADWSSNVVVDGNLYTGQNPASAGPLAARMKADLLA